jgi:hypothetical protein
MKDRLILVWQVPTEAEAGHEREAALTLVEPLIDPGTDRVRVWAEIDNSKGDLIPGTAVTLAAYPP